MPLGILVSTLSKEYVRFLLHCFNKTCKVESWTKTILDDTEEGHAMIVSKRLGSVKLFMI